MTLVSIGDLSQSLVLRSRAAMLKKDMSRLTSELASGQSRTTLEKVSGSYTYLAGIEHGLARTESLGLAASEARMFAEGMQSRLEQLRQTSGSLSASLLPVGNGTDLSQIAHLSQRAHQALDASVAVLNGSVAGRSLFAGTATDTAPLESSDALVTALRVELVGATSASDVLTAADAWFADPAGYGASIYRGATQALAPFELGNGQTVNMPLRADSDVLRNQLRDFAIAALVADTALAFSADTQRAVLATIGRRLQGAQSSIATLQADLGFTQARVDEAQTRNGTERAALEMARSALLDADPYETATKLEEVQFRLEALFSATVRTSRLSLVNFLS